MSLEYPISMPIYSDGIWLTVFIICLLLTIISLKVYDSITNKMSKKNGNNENLSERIEECSQDV